MHKRFPIYESLLRLYPKPYRDKYAGQMVQTLQDMLDDQPGKAARILAWLRAGVDLPLGIMQQNLTYVGDVMTNQTPHYVKRNALISTALILPFFASVLLQASQSNNQMVRSSLYLSFFVLPLAAFALIVTTLALWSRHDHEAWWRKVLDVRRSWLLALVAVLAIGIPLLVMFHDSVHCVIGNPVRVLHNPHQTMQCVADGSFGGK